MLLGCILLPLLLIDIPLSKVTNALPETINAKDLLSFAGETRSEEQTLSTEQLYLRPTDSDSMGKPARTLDALVTGAVSTVEMRIMEDHQVLARQSVPTGTTPFPVRFGLGRRLAQTHEWQLLL